jgi:DNA primase catalytic core
MPRIPDAEIERLKRAVSLAELCRQRGIELKPHGSQDLIGCCPFHDDREPSFVITPSKNLWHCLGACQRGGSVIDFVMLAEKVSFRHAVEILQRQSGAAPPSPTVKTRQGVEHPILVEPQSEWSDAALRARVAEFYHRSFCNDPLAMRYLEKRRCFHPEAAKLFQIGFANRTLGYRVPPSETAHGRRLKEQLQRIGVLRDSGHEHLNGSVVFPLFDEHGQVVQMYGRKLRDDLREGTPKHLYLKGDHRGVWNGAALACQEEWIVCEAILDALTLWCHGFRHVTASYGVNGWTADHLALVRRVRPKKAFLAYDNDDAGHQAANSLAAVLAAEGVTTYRLAVPTGKDINGFVCALARDRENDVAAALRALLIAAPLMLPGENKPVQVESGESRVESQKPETPSVPSLAAESPSLPSTLPASRSMLDELSLTCGECEPHRRFWRVRGLEKNLSFELLKVNVRLAVAESFHLDTLDLYSARARAAFCAAASEVTGLDAKLLAADLAPVLLACEERQTKLIYEKLSPPAAVEAPKMTSEEEREAMEMLKSPKLIEIILHDFQACGFIGEQTNKLVGYLACLSRKLEEPLSVLIASRSAAGKSSLMQALLRFVPDEDKEEFTAITGQALFYIGENDLAHKVLAVAEDQGSHQADYSLKTFQSDKHLIIASTGKDPKTGQLKTERRKVNGPVALLTTSTATEINEELANRFLVLTVNEDRNQTRAIHQAQRHAETLDGLLQRKEHSRILRRHQNAQRLLRPLHVINPHAPQLQFGEGQLRARRDHKKYLGLIRALAFLHQHQRKIQSVTHRGEVLQYVEVEPSDIERADALMREVLGPTTDERSPQALRLLDLINRLTAERAAEDKLSWDKVWWTRRQLREQSGWRQRQLRAALRQLVDLEYVAQRGGGLGRTEFYQVIDDPTSSLVEPPRRPCPPPVRVERTSATASSLAASAAKNGTCPPFPNARSGTGACPVAS